MESQKEQALHPLLLPLCVLVCGGAMIGVFRLLGKLDDSVLYGAALGCGICILNLFLLRFTMNRAAAATSPQAAQQIAKASVPPRLLPSPLSSPNSRANADCMAPVSCVSRSSSTSWVASPERGSSRPALYSSRFSRHRSTMPGRDGSSAVTRSASGTRAMNTPRSSPCRTSGSKSFPSSGSHSGSFERVWRGK